MAIEGEEDVDLTDIYDKIRRMPTIREQIKQLEEEKDAIENLVKSRLGNAENGYIYDDIRVVRWSNGARNTLDVKALEAEYPEIAAKFTTKKPYRSMKFQMGAFKTVEAGGGEFVEKSPDTGAVVFIGEPEEFFEE